MILTKFLLLLRSGQVWWYKSGPWTTGAAGFWKFDGKQTMSGLVDLPR